MSGRIRPAGGGEFDGITNSIPRHIHIAAAVEGQGEGITIIIATAAQEGRGVQGSQVIIQPGHEDIPTTTMSARIRPAGGGEIG